MKTSCAESKSFIYSLLAPKAILFGFSLLVCISALVTWSQVHDELEQLGAFDVQDHFYPPIYILLLPLAALPLCFRWTWGHITSTVISGILIYRLLYLPLTGYANAFDDPLLSDTINRWWTNTYAYQTQEILHLAIATLIFLTSIKYACASALKFYRVSLRKYSAK